MSDSAFADFTEQVLSLSYEQTIILMGKMLESLKNKRNEENYAEWKMTFPEAQWMPCGRNWKMTHGEIWLIDFRLWYSCWKPSFKNPACGCDAEWLLGIKDLNTVVAIPFTSNLVPSEYEPNILFKKEETGLSKDSVAVIHLIGAVNKFSFERKVSKLSEENYQKLVDAVIKLISDRK